MEDILSHMGTFLTNKDVFIASGVNREWRESQIPNKRTLLKKVKREIETAHVCDNCCPCLLEKYYQNIIDDFKLKRYLCSLLNHKKIPPWLHTYID